MAVIDRALAPGAIAVERVYGRCGGKPVIAGTRLPTASVLSLFLSGYSIERLGREYPTVTTVQIESAIRFEACLAAGRKWAVAFARKRLRGPGAFGISDPLR